MSIALMTKAWEMDLPTGPKFVLVALCDNANDEGMCYPSIGHIARKCGMLDRAIQRNILILEQRGILSREYRNQRSTVYYIHASAMVQDGCLKDTQGCIKDTLSPSLRHPPPVLKTPVTIIEPSVEPNTLLPTAFEEFWKAYPNKKNKGAAVRAWKKIKPKTFTLTELLDGIERCKRSREWRGGFVPHPATWLNGWGWLNEAEAPEAEYAGNVL